MLKPTLLNIILFWLVKYFVYYFLLMFKNNNFTLVKVNELNNLEDFFYYAWLFLSMPLLCVIFFLAPTYFTFKLKKIIHLILIMLIIVVVEYFLYTWLASPSNLINGIYNAVISVIFIIVFFYRYIYDLYHNNSLKI